jgi:hypothetical protein
VAERRGQKVAESRKLRARNSEQKAEVGSEQGAGDIEERAVYAPILRHLQVSIDIVP